MSAEVYDLDAVAAEVAKEPFPFNYQGREWVLAHLSDVDWRLVEEADKGSITAIRAVIHAGFGCVHDGDNVEHSEQAREFDKRPQPISAMTALFNRWLAHAGLREGESPASPDSSGSTAGPSNRASRRATKSTSAGSSRAR